MLHTPHMYTSLHPYSILKGSCCTIASLVQAPGPLTTKHCLGIHPWRPGLGPGTSPMPSLHVGPLLGNPLAAFLPVQPPGEGGTAVYFPNLMSSYSCSEEKGQRQEAVTQSVNVTVALALVHTSSSSDPSTSPMSLSDSLSGSSLSSCAVFSYSSQRISSLWRP